MIVEYRLKPGNSLFLIETKIPLALLVLCSILVGAISISATSTSEPNSGDHHITTHHEDNSNMIFGSSSAENNHFHQDGISESGQYNPHEHPEINYDYHPVQEQTPNHSSNDNLHPNTLLFSDKSNNHHQQIHNIDSSNSKIEQVISDSSTKQQLFPDIVLQQEQQEQQQQQQQQRQHKQQTTFNYKEYLDSGLADRTCALDRGCQRKDRLNNTYLTFCTRYKLENMLSSRILMSIMHDKPEICAGILDEFIRLDELIEQFHVLFKKILTRYNCHNGYSVKWSCEDCKIAYQDWLCATSLPYYMNGERIKPCISFCERVEQRCPYLHPITKEQYGGQPVFICRDPNIPFVPEITPDIPYSEPSKCYDLCHLSQNITELVIDSLSKYDPNKCPDKNLVAEQVRNDIYCQVQYPMKNNGTTFGSDDESVVHTNEDDRDHINGTLNGLDSDKRKPSDSTDVHMKKLNELKEVLAIYKRQPETHRFGIHSEH